MKTATGHFSMGLVCLVSIGVALVALAAAARAVEHELWAFQCMSQYPEESQLCTTEIALGDDGLDVLIYFVHNRKRRPPLVAAVGDHDLVEVDIVVDGKDSLATRLCDGGLCHYGLEDSRVLMRRFRKGRSARIVMTLSDGNALEREFTLRGFTAAYDAYRP